MTPPNATHASSTSRTRKSRDLSRQNDNYRNQETEIVLCEGLSYLKDQLELSDTKVGKLLRVPRSTVNHWLNKGRVPIQEDGTLTNDAECLVNLIAIHKNLEAMLEEPAAEIEWLHMYREEFGTKPFDKIASSIEGLFEVRKYLDYMRGRGA